MNKILLRIIFVIALIIAIVLIAIAIIRFSPRFFSYVGSASASLFNVFKKESLDVSVAPQTIISGNTVVISWPTDDQNSASLIFACNDEYSLTYLGENATRIPLQCGEDFELGGSTGSVALIAQLKKKNTFNDIEVTINQIRTDDTKASGVAVITVTNETSSDTTPSPIATTTKPKADTKPGLTSTPIVTPTNTQSPKTVTIPQQTPVVSGPANLTLSQPTYVYGIGPAVQFTVTNNGGSNSGTWEIRAQLPNGDTFNSGTLYGLPAGASSLFTLNIGTVYKGTNTMRITVDATNIVTESNESDNVREVTFTSATGNSTTPTSGKADLVPKVLSINYLYGDTIGIRFEIRNVGGSTAKDWRFEAELPTDNEDDSEFRSSRQPDLKPGEAIEYTLSFDDARSRGYATIDVDTEKEVNESNESNNDIRFRVTN